MHRSASVRKIAIVGSGPMGLSLASFLLTEIPIVLVVRNQKQRESLIIHGIKNNFLNHDKSKTNNLTIISSVKELSDFKDIDLVFLATKSTAIQIVCENLRNILNPNAFVVSYQNGFNSGKHVIESLKSHNVLRMILYYGATLDHNNHVDITFSSPPHLIGALKKEHFDLAAKIATLLTKCGLHTIFKEDIEPDIWKKSILNAVTSPVCALTRTTIKEAMESPSQSLICLLLQEAVNVASKEKINLPESFYETSVDYLKTLGNHYPSMVHDVLNHSPTEITQLNEQICNIGKKHGVPTVANKAIVSLIQTIDFKNVYLPK